MRKACIDTNILGWFVKGYTSDDDEVKLEKSRFLFEWLEEQQVNVVIPSLVVGEMMSDVEDEGERERISDFVSANFEVLQHDIMSARQFAGMRIELDKKNVKQYRHQNNVPKCRMINDYNICSVALSNNCDVIFTNNTKDFEVFLNDKIPVFSLDYVDIIKKDIADKEDEEKLKAEEAERIIIEKEEAKKILPDSTLFPGKLEEYQRISDKNKEGE